MEQNYPEIIKKFKIVLKELSILLGNSGMGR